MKQFVLLPILLFGLLLLTATAQTQNSETHNSETPNSAAASAAMSENDRIGFMAERDQTTASSAPGSGSLIIRTLGSMCLIVGLIFAVAWALKRFDLIKNNQIEVVDAPALKVVSNVSLGANRTLSIVKFGNRTLLVGSTAHSVSLLASEDASPSINENAAINQISGARSVSDLLAAEDASFSDELKIAESQMGFSQTTRSDV